MPQQPVIVSLPISDRPTSLAFYRDGLSLEPFGPLADDGVPEPLQFELAKGVHLMLIPSGGFGWVIGENEVAAKGTSECLLSIGADGAAEVDSLLARATAAGATIMGPASDKPWGYCATLADPDGHLWQITTPPFPS